MKDDNIIIKITLSMLLIIAFVYYLFVFKPQEDKENTAYQKSENLKICLIQAEESYFSSWNRACEVRKLKEDCSLNNSTASSIEEYKKDENNKCYKIYD